MPTQAIRLGVNIDHVATVREARGTAYPDILAAALAAEAAGADLITVHLREDRRHIQDADVMRLAAGIGTSLNFEMAATPEMIAIALDLSPAACCIVPERREELTTEGGLDVIGLERELAPGCRQLSAAGIEVSLFVDPDPGQIAAAARIGVGAIELHTGTYAELAPGSRRENALAQLSACAEQGAAAGLRVNAGHGLHYDNVQPVAAIATISELNIGHAIVARAIFDGLGPAVAEMKRLMTAARA